MIIKEEVKILKEVDIGPLDTALKLPMAPRINYGMKTICDVCHKDIKGRFFIAGLKKGYVNMKFCESCIDDNTRSKIRK